MGVVLSALLQAGHRPLLPFGTAIPTTPPSTRKVSCAVCSARQAGW